MRVITADCQTLCRLRQKVSYAITDATRNALCLYSTAEASAKVVDMALVGVLTSDWFSAAMSFEEITSISFS